MKEFITTDGNNKIIRRSRWIRVRTDYARRVNKNNSNYDYYTDGSGYSTYDDKFDPTEGVYLDYFTYKGKKYPLSRFYSLGCQWLSMSPYEFIDTDGKPLYIGAMDMDGDLYITGDTLYLEMDEYGERVRVYNVESIERR